MFENLIINEEWVTQTIYLLNWINECALSKYTTEN